MATADAMQPSPPPTVVPLAPPDSDVPTEAPAPMSAAAVAQAAAEPPPETLPVPPPVAQPSVPPVKTKPDTRVFRPPQPRHAPRVPPKRSEPPATPASQPTAQPAPPPASSRASSPAAAATINPSWTNELGAWLQAHKSYPELARERGEEGTVAVRLTVARDGRVLNVAVARGSGSGTLDGAAAAMLRNARVPPFPFSMPQAEVTVTVALRYMLER